MKKNIQYDGELQVAAGQLTKEGDYWLEKLSGFPLDLEKNSFPADYGEGEKGKGDKETASMPITLPGELVSSLLKLSNKSDSRLFMILTAGLVLTIHKYTGRSDIITGAPIYKQEIDGEFINTVLPLRNRLREDMTFKDLLLDVRRTITEAEENQNYPMSTLLYKLNMPASGDRFPLFDTALLLENIHDKKHIRHTGPAVLFSFFRVDDRIETVLEYHPTLYREETMARLMSHFSHLLLNALSDVSQKTNQLEMLSEAEIKQLLVEFNDTHREYPIDKAIHQLFEEQVEKTPGNTAVAAPDLPAGASAQPDAQEKNPDINAGRRTLTYRELNEESNRLAHYLKDRGVTANSVVGLMQERSTDLVTGMLGIMKAGGAYLPMDPQMPKQRAVTMLEDSSASHLLTHGKVFSDHSFTSLQGLEERSVPIHTTCPRKPLANLDSLPIPDRSLVDYEKYNRYIGQVMVKNIISLQTARGCPYNCFYCSKVWPRKHTFRTAENIFEELQLYYDMGFRRFSIFDDIFNINLKNGEKLFEKIIKSNLDIQLFFPNGLRGDLLNKDYIDLLVEAGLATTAMALETASPRLQKMIDKNLHLEKFRENVEYFCKKYPQVVLELFTIHGFPTETEEEARLTLEFIKEQEWLHFPYVFILKIYPGTEMADLAMEHGVLREDILKCEDLALHEYSPTSPFSESFTKNYQAEFLNDYFLNKERLRHVLPYQARVLTEDEIVQKYDSYLPSGIDSFSDILDLAGIDEADLGIESFLEEENFAVPELNRKLRSAFPAHQPAEDALKLLLVDLSQFFSWDTDMLYDVVEPPLGPIYILTYLQEQLGSEINGKIIKSRIDFDNYEDLKTLLDDFQPDVIGVRTLTFYKDFFHKTISLIRQWGFAGPLIAGGPYATRNTAPLLQDRNIDLAVLSEGEVTFLEIIEKILENSGRLPGREELEKIDGIAFAPRTSQKSYRFARQILMADTLSETLSKQSVANPGFPVEPTLPAYIMYTSGSTGAPKGVVVEHKNVVNVLHWFAEAYDLREEDRIIQLTGFTFDPSVEQIFSALHRGASVYMPHKELISNREDFSRYIEENRITIINFVPATLRTLLADEQQGQFSSLRAVISGGDRLDDALKDSLIAKGYELYNHYGPTETTIDTLRGKCSPGEKVNLGTPIANVQCFVLGGDLRLLPVGVPGELYIAGAGVSRGYLNHPELTAERFIRGGAAHRKFLEVSEP
ncbi:MAG: AMP-binding protein, partial [Candidatus Aminicenantes bacterium]|nr:AMP-binding protein [Candidatus Aminicenantes bacterium]